MHSRPATEGLRKIDGSVSGTGERWVCGGVSLYMLRLYEGYRAAQFPLPRQCFPCLPHKSQSKLQCRTLLLPHLCRNSAILPLRGPWPCRQHQTLCSMGGQARCDPKKWDCLSSSRLSSLAHGLSRCNGMDPATDNLLHPSPRSWGTFGAVARAMSICIQQSPVTS